jgi:hypothetical protein
MTTRMTPFERNSVLLSVVIMNRFSAPIYKIGINPAVDPPPDVLRSIFAAVGRDKGPISVQGTISGAEFIQTLVKYAGAWRLYMNGKMLTDSGLKVGDIAEIEIAYDPRPREMPMLPELQSALDDDGRARQAFKQLSPSRKKEILSYLGNLKTEKSLMRNIHRVIAQLRSDSAGNRPGDGRA